MNKVILLGNLTADPEVKVVNSGKQTTVANFTLAVSRVYTKANGERDKDTTFVSCEAWDTGAETIGQYCKKGDPLLVEGSLKMEQWEKDGQKHSRLKVRVSNFHLLWRKPASKESDVQDQV